MSVNQRPKVAYGLSEPNFGVGPFPIIVNRMPTTADTAEVGTIWINPLTNEAWALTSVVANIANWLPLGITDYGVGTDGQILIAATGALPTFNAITAGPGITVGLAPHHTTISVTGGGLSWAPVAVDGAFVNGQGVIVNKAALLTMTLPAVAAVGTQIAIQGTVFGAGGWSIAQNALQSIQVGANSTTIGVAGSLSSQNSNDGITLICVTANTIWQAITGVGNFDII